MKMKVRSRAIDKIYKRRDKIEMPDYQREEVWPTVKKQALIDTILRGWHLPKFYFKLGPDGTNECVDGQQRLSAIFEFFDGKVALDAQTSAKFGGATYGELPDDVSDSFDDFEIEIEEIEEASDEDLEELFQRLQLGTPLISAEKLNAVSGEIRKFCHDCAEKPFFKNKLPIKNTRFAHFEIVARWAFIEARGIQPQMRFPQLEEFFKDNRRFNRTSDLAKTIEGSIRLLDKAFDKSPSFIANRANTLSVCMLASRMVRAKIDTDENAKILGTFLRGFFAALSAEVQKGVKADDSELLLYQQAISAGSTGGDSIRNRVDVLSRRLALDHPEYASLVGGWSGLVTAMQSPLVETADQIRKNIYRVNKNYEAAHGESLFKMTTESVNALGLLDRPVQNKSEYGDFIDALYFLVYEGSGACSRFGEEPPGFAMDVKFLRTALRHDVDHGKDKEVVKKMKRLGEVFEKYSRHRTPEECGEEEFLSIQYSLLRGCLAMLKSIE